MGDIEAAFIAVHAQPVWRDEADHVIRALLRDGGSEQLWASRVSEGKYKICCIPFFVYDISLGDIVAVDGDYCIISSLSRSEYFTFRIYFPKFLEIFEQEEFLSQIGVNFMAERCSKSLVALCVSGKRVAEVLSGMLAKAESNGLLEYETGDQDFTR